jgi:hypothetical protein
MERLRPNAGLVYVAGLAYGHLGALELAHTLDEYASSNRHLAWPSLCVLVVSLASLRFDNADTTLLLALPPLRRLAAFSLATMNRQVSALEIGLQSCFFRCVAVVIRVVWVAMQTGIPQAPATNVKRRTPGFRAPCHWAGVVFWLCGKPGMGRLGALAQRTAPQSNLEKSGAASGRCDLMLVASGDLVDALA